MTINGNKWNVIVSDDKAVFTTSCIKPIAITYDIISQHTLREFFLFRRILLPGIVIDEINKTFKRRG